ncbi:MAG: serine acetyltransferase [Spirochaetaceae bacterium]|nr:serine acetyltransferase [Spirochaetaceae bacterium]
MNNKIAETIEQAVKSLNSCESDCRNYPSRAEIIGLIDKLRLILFFDFFEENFSLTLPAGERLRTLLWQLSSNLVTQIALAYPYNPKVNNHTDKEILALAQGITANFMAAIPQIKEELATDIEAAFNGDPAAESRVEIILAYPGLYATMVYRIANRFYNLGVPLIPRIMAEYAHSLTAIDIHPAATIGRHFFIDHGSGTVIGATAHIGNHVKIYQGVTLGALSTKEGQKLKNIKRHPTIKDNATIYAGATILGGETVIGENAVIGGNAFIAKSVPNNTVVRVRNPELQYKGDGATAWSNF